MKKTFFLITFLMASASAAQADNASIDDKCVNAMRVSPEYAWAIAHPEAHSLNDPLDDARSGIVQNFTWPGSPHFLGSFPGTILKGRLLPLVSVNASPEQKANNVWQTEAVELAGAYREMVDKGFSEDKIAQEMNADTRKFCDNIQNPAYLQGLQ